MLNGKLSACTNIVWSLKMRLTITISSKNILCAYLRQHANYHGCYRIFELLPKEWFCYLPSLDAAEISKLNAFLATDAYKAVSDN